MNFTTPTSTLSIFRYGPFGMALEGRNWSVGSEYRYGFNGMENDNEIAGDNNTLDFGARIYDARLGRWLSVDPLQTKYPDLSSYSAFNKDPTVIVDPDGKKLYLYGTTEKDLMQAMIDIMDLVSCSDQSRITFKKMDDSDIYEVLFDNTAAAGPAMDGTNSGLTLLTDLVTAKENVLYGVSDYGEYISCGKTENRDFLPSRESKTGLINVSDTKKWPDYNYQLTDKNTMYEGISQKLKGGKCWDTPLDRPGLDIQGAVTITNSGYWEWDGFEISRAFIVFHELAENYERTVNHKPYEIPYFNDLGKAIGNIYMTPDYLNDPSKNGDSAHDISYDKSKKYNHDGKNMGEGGTAKFHSTYNFE